MSLFLSALGLMLVFEGMIYFCFPARIKEMARRIPELRDGVLVSFGLALMLIGLLLVYLGRTFG